MNRELCNNIGVIVLDESSAKSLEAMLSSVTFVNFSYEFESDDFTIQETVNKGEHGIRYEIDKQIIIEMPDRNILRKFGITRRCIVRIKDASGRQYIIGSTQFPAQVRILPGLNKAVLYLKSASITSVFI